MKHVLQAAAQDSFFKFSHFYNFQAEVLRRYVFVPTLGTYIQESTVQQVVSPQKITVVQCALFIATQNGKLRDVCKDIWHVQTQDENSVELSGRVARTMNFIVFVMQEPPLEL